MLHLAMHRSLVTIFGSYLLATYHLVLTVPLTLLSIP
jgi:hypothetical protein